MSDAARSRVSVLAASSLVVGAGALVLWGLGGLGLLALALGWLAIRDINLGKGRVWGRKAALAGMALGAGAFAVTLFGILAQILLPSWEASRRARCLHNLGAIGTSANQFRDVMGTKAGGNGHFPQAAVPNANLAAGDRLSWLVELVPFLEPAEPRGSKRPRAAGRIALNEAWNSSANQEVGQTNFPTFRCPSFPASDRRGLSTYVGIAGIDPDAAFLPVESPRAGALGFARQIAPHDVAAVLHHTLLATETIVHNGPWIAAGVPTLRGLDPEETRYVGSANNPFGGCHRAGANGVFLDGSARFIRDDIHPAVMRSMATLAGTGLEPD